MPFFYRQVNQGGGGDLQTAAGPGQNGNQPAAKQKDLRGEKRPPSRHPPVSKPLKMQQRYRCFRRQSATLELEEFNIVILKKSQ